MTDDELVEKVARAIRHEVNNPAHTAASVSRAAIAVLRPLVLEEAAKVADGMPLSHPGNAAETAIECAAAIRALKD